METDKSPYAPPGSDIESAVLDSIAIVPAGKWLRLFNYLIDYVGRYLLVIVVLIVIGLFFGEAAIDYFDSVPGLLLGIALMLLYYLPLEFLTGRTFGKLVTGTRVVTEDGLRPSFRQILGRTLARLVPFEPFSFLGRTGRGWHDTWPKTYVVKTRGVSRKQA